MSGKDTGTGVTGSVKVGSYDLSETGGPTGYQRTGLTCSNTGDQQVTKVTLVLGDDVTCTFVNTDEPGTITLRKIVNDNGADAGYGPKDWVLSATIPGAKDPVVSGNGKDGVEATPISAGIYTLGEAGPAGYTASNWSCDTASGVSLIGSTLTIGNGASANCEITNTAKTPKLTLVKTVTNSYGGDSVVGDWTLTADGNTTISGVTGATAVTAASVPVGSYDLSEASNRSQDAAGYTLSSLLCKTAAGAVFAGVDPTHPGIDLALGDDVTCTFTNTDKPGTITLEKFIDHNAVNDGKVPADWTLTATPQNIDGQGAVSGVGDPNATTPKAGVKRVPVFAGTYLLSESGPSGFTAGKWECTGGTQSGDNGQYVTVPNGVDVYCDITNTAQLAQLTLIKIVDNGDTGGIGTPRTWTLTADATANHGSVITGKTGDAAITDANVKAGTYSLSEDNPIEGYTAGAWNCTGDEAAFGSAVSLQAGDHVTCTITNTAQPATWTVGKTSDPASGSTVNPGDTITYTLTLKHTGGVLPAALDIPDDVSGVLPHATVDAASFDPSFGTASLDLPNKQIIWSVGGATAETMTLSYTVTVNADAWDTHIRNVVTPPKGGTCVTDGGCATDNPTPHFTFWKTVDPATGSTVQPGDTVTYTLHAHNDSDATVQGKTATDDLTDVLSHATLGALPSGLTFDGQHTLTWAIPTIAKGGADATVSFTVTVKPDAWGITLTNVATPGDGGDCTSDTACTTHNPTSHYVLSKTSVPATGSTVNPGDSVVYTLHVHNDSDGIVTGAQVTDDLSKVLGNATLDTANLAAGLTFDGAHTLTWSVPDVDPGKDVTVSYTVTVKPGADGVTLTNVATPGSGGDCVSAADCTTTQSSPHWVLSKTSDPGSGSTVNPGDTVTYTLKAHNDSKVDVTGAVTTDDLSDVVNHAILLNADDLPTGVTYNSTTHTLTWHVPTLTPGADATVSYQVKISAGADGVQLKNVATPNPSGSCVSDNGCTTNNPTPHWVLSKTSDPASGETVNPGGHDRLHAARAQRLGGNRDGRHSDGRPE